MALACASGCGGSDGDERARQAPATTAKKQRETAPYEVPARPKPKPRQRERSRAERLAKRRRPLVRSVAASQLELVGLGSPAIKTSDRARAVTITVSEEAACSAARRDGARVADALRDALPFVREVRVRVYGYDGSLAAYQRKCRRPARLGDGPVLETDGTGAATTAPFTVRSARWTLAYTAEGDLFRLRVLRGGRLVRQIGLPLKGSGERTLTGAGVYRIEVEAKGGWSLTARELP